MKPDLLVVLLGLAVLTLIPMGWLAKPGSAATFTPPTDNSAPREGSGGASRGAFIPPADNSAPREGSGGASRGAFIPPADNSAPQQAAGGASRGAFIPPADNSAPQQAAGGASRGEFVLPADNSAPQQAAGGASRGEFLLPEDQTSPGQTASGASRANTYGQLDAASPVTMMAVMPESFYGTTLLERPTIMVYLPATGVNEAIFSLKDEAGNLVYRTEVSISGNEGIIAIPIPEEAPPLAIGVNYQWFFTLPLEGGLTPNSPFVDAWIQRIEPSPALAEALAQGDTLANAEVLATSGIWYDSAALFAQLRLEQPESSEIVQHWEEFLHSVSLHTLTSEPILTARLYD
jgi:hypothetical protein